MENTLWISLHSHFSEATIINHVFKKNIPEYLMHMKKKLHIFCLMFCKRHFKGSFFFFLFCKN